LAVTLPAKAKGFRVFTHRAGPSTLSRAGRVPPGICVAALVALPGFSAPAGDVKVEIGSPDSPRPRRLGAHRL
jgi:hypothetical protein